MRLLTTVVLAAGVFAQGAASQVAIKPQISEKRGLADWDLDGNGTWAVRGPVLILEKEGTPGGKIRRPAALAILKSEPLTDLTFRVELRSTAPVDLAVRDVQLVVGYQSPTQFYYIHLSAKTDAVHNGIFLVNNADRRRIDEPNSKAHLTDEAWHRIRLERNVSTGSIAVFFDDETTPMLSATDKTLAWGRVGVGSFDETGEFRNVDVSGKRAKSLIPGPSSRIPYPESLILNP
jgi:hypothetical protein